MKKIFIIMTSITAIALLYYIEQITRVNYMVKTIIKIILFTGIPLLYIYVIKKSTLRKFLNYERLNKKHLYLGILFGALSFLIILAAYFILENYIDVEGILSEMGSKSKITPGNFVFVGIYITFGNSFIEELFFRGFIFLEVYRMGFRKTAYIFSSILFGLYHIAIFQTWFNAGLIGLAMLGLITIGLIFSWLNTRSENILNSYLVHILADIAIILVGLRLFNMV